MAKTVLFIDDTQETLVLLMRAARLAGGVPRVARTLEAARKIIAQAPPEVIFVDYRLAETDGLSVIRWLRGLPQTREARIYLLSAEGDPRLRRSALEMGADGFLEKPLGLDTLMEVLHG